MRESTKRPIGGAVSRWSPYIVVLCLAVSDPAVGQELMPPALLSSPDPLRIAFPAFAIPISPNPEGGSWEVTVSVGWFNLWSADGRAASVRRELGLPRQEQITDDELRLLALRYPDDDLVHADLEGVVVQTMATVGLTAHVALTLRIPWISTGHPDWDAIPEQWHDLFGLTQSNRLWFPRGGSLLYVEGQGVEVIRRDLDGSGFGDVTVSVTGTIGSWLGADHDVVGAIDLPTGDRDTLRGSGGVDVGVRWFGRWQVGRSRVIAGAGLTRLDRGGSLLGIERSDTWHVGVTVARPFGSRISGIASSAYESSPLARFTASDAGDPAFRGSLGMSLRVADATWASLVYGMDSTRTGLSPDVSLRVEVVARF